MKERRQEASTMMGWYHDGGFGAGDWIAMMAMMVVFWALVVGAGVMIFRSGRGGEGTRRGDGTASRDPMEILDERFARGELDREEYEDRRDVLRDGRR
ncbi:MAG: SHOCT domain-containing protein [Nocardioidaceae bacterium]